MPEATGRFFSSSKAAPAADPGVIGEQPGGAQHQIVALGRRGPRLHRPIISSETALAGRAVRRSPISANATRLSTR